MSWLRSAVSKAVEVGNKNNLTRAVKSYADNVVQQAGQAVAEGAKILQDRIATRNFKSVKQTTQRLEEAAVSCRGPERVLLLRRWLYVLKEVEKWTEDQQKSPEVQVQQSSDEEAKDSSRRVAMFLYYDQEGGGIPMTFREVFLQSKALEGIIMSMILEAPNDEEVSLLLEMFGLCLTGGKEVHHAIVSSIQDLATAFASYQDEVLVKRDELLQFAQAAITGLKINTDLLRINAEAIDLKSKLDGMISTEKTPSEDQEKVSDETTEASIEGLKKALGQIRTCSQLEGLLLKKKNINFGDMPEVHAHKVDKLKVLSESLASSTTKSEKRIIDHRSQKEEALKVRVTKAEEANEKEKEIAGEIDVLEKRRDELEAELKKVNTSLAAANARLRNAREERDQFDEANNQIVEHLITREDELSKSVAACKVEADVLSKWINFLEDTWVLQCTYTEATEQQTNDELERHEICFRNLAIQLLSDYKKNLGPSISRIGKFVENLKKLENGSDMPSSVHHEDPNGLSPRKDLEEEYLAYEAKIITTLSVVDNMRKQFYAQQRENSWKENPTVKELFDDIEKLRAEFESIERPILQVEIPAPLATQTAVEKQPESPSSSTQDASIVKPTAEEHPTVVHVGEPEHVLDTAAELAQLESEFGKVGTDYSKEEIGEWEFDELEKELRSGDTTATT